MRMDQHINSKPKSPFWPNRIDFLKIE